MLALERAPFLPNHVKSLTPLDIDLCLVSGGAQGPDTIAENWAKEQGFTTDIKEPDWNDWSGEHPAKARNTDIAQASDVVVAVWDGQSNGTRDTIDKTLDRGKPIYVEVFDE